MAVRACVIGRQKMGNLCVFGRNVLRHGKRENLDVREDKESIEGQHANRAGSGVGLTYACHRGTSHDRAQTGTRDATQGLNPS